MIIAKQGEFDPVPLAALLPGAISLIAPFALLKENRVVDGIPMSGFQLAGAWNWILIGVFILVFLASFLKKTLWRSVLYGGSGLLCFWAMAWLLVRGSFLLPEGAAPRISPAWGFWGLPIAAYVLIDHSRIFRFRFGGLVLLTLLILPTALLFSGGRGEAISVMREWSARKDRFGAEFVVHLRLFLTAVGGATLLGIPLGVQAARGGRSGASVVSFVDAAQTIPSMALFGLLMAPLAALSQAFPLLRTLGVRGIGAAPALIALTLYALLPIVRNTVVGLEQVPDSALEAGLGMGMSPPQLFWRVQWPMALPYVLTGLKTASVQAVGNTAVAALIGAGGLGMMIFQGLGQSAPDLILLGVIPLVLLAVGVDRIWGFVILRTVSPGLSTVGGDS
ncbi:MAG: ABC transporter permease [Spirochaetales bacterium]|nr:ABC transporter permease [Spirochaetales bacterium]